MATEIGYDETTRGVQTKARTEAGTYVERRDRLPEAPSFIEGANFMAATGTTIALKS